MKQPDFSGIRCLQCGGERFELDVGTEIIERDVMLSELGVPPGKAVIAHVAGRAIYVLRQE